MLIFNLQAALGQIDTTVNSPILGNVGYVVVVLKQEKNESAMPEVVMGNLTARIRYDITNAFGLEPATFYLPVTSNADWNSQKASSSFWNGQGSLRADYIEDNKARISIYNYDKRVDTVDLTVGGSSGKVDFPGLNCMAGFEIKLDSVSNPTDTAVLDVDGSTIEVALGDSFLENRCKLISLPVNQGQKKSATIKCTPDQGDTSKAFTLRISPSVKLKIDETAKDYNLGQQLYTFTDKGIEKAAYIGYIGGTYANPIVVIVAGETSKLGDELSDEALIKSAEYVEKYYQDESKDIQTTPEKIWEFYKNNNLPVTIAKGYISGWSSLIRLAFGGAQYQDLLGGESANILDRKIEMVSISSPINQNVLDEVSESGETLGELYSKAKEDYKNVVDTYASREKYPDGSGQQLGEQALYDLINLADALGQKADVETYCDEFEEKYPKGNFFDSLFVNGGVCVNLFELSSSTSASQAVVIDGVTSVIKLVDVDTPDATEYGVKVSLGGAKDSDYNGDFTIKKDGYRYLSSDDKDSIQLISLEGLGKW